MKHKAGDTVRIQSPEWLEEHGYSEDVKSIAGKIAGITGVEHGVYENRYRIDLDNGRHLWEEDEFDPGYRPEKRKRPMDRLEIIAWANSEESLGWMTQCGGSLWTFPRHFSYTGESEDYRRARLLPDLSGVDPDTIQGFEVEE